MRHLHKLCGLTLVWVLVVGGPAMGQSLTIQLDGETNLVDLGYTAPRHMVKLTNTGSKKLVIVSVNGRTLGPPNFSMIGRMKGPPSHWSQWRNVLAPGQSTTVFGGRGPKGPGAYTVKIRVRFAEASAEFEQQHVKEVVQGKMTSPHQIQYAVGVPNDGPVWVTYASERLKDSELRTTEKSWPIYVKADPVISGLTEARKVKRFRSVPVFGHLVEKEDGVYRVVDSELVRIPKEFEGFARLGECIGRHKRCTIKSLGRPAGLPQGLAVSVQANVPMATSRIRAFSSIKEWYVFHVEAAGVKGLLRAMRAGDWTLRHDDHDGLVLIADPTLIPLGVRGFPVKPNLP